MKSSIKIIIISGLPGIPTEKLIENLFTYFPNTPFISSSSVLLYQKYDQSNTKKIIAEATSAANGERVVIMSPNVYDAVAILQGDFFKEVTAAFFLVAENSVLEDGIKARCEDPLPKVIEADCQREILSRYRNLFDHIFDFSPLTQGDITIAIVEKLRNYGFAWPEEIY